MHRITGFIDLSRIKHAYDRFNQTLQEGHYGADKSSLWSRLFTPKSNNDDAAAIIAGNKLFKLSSKTLSTKYLLPPIIAVLSMQMQIATILAIGAIGTGILAVEYMRCRRMAQEVITEVNVAGQKVTGTRSDLYRLHRAQANILNLSSSFRPASIEDTHDTITDIMNTVAAERTRVTVVGNGPYGAGNGEYQFSRQMLGLVAIDRNRDAAPAIDARMTQPLNGDQVVDRMLALESALPEDLRVRFRAALDRTPVATPATANNTHGRKAAPALQVVAA